MPIILQIFEVYNTGTATSLNQDENNSNEETKLETAHQNILTSEKRLIALNKYIAVALVILEYKDRIKLQNT